jgi:hypothetical protein
MMDRIECNTDREEQRGTEKNREEQRMKAENKEASRK